MTKVALEVTCHLCNTKHELHLKQDDLNRYRNGEHIQNVMSYLSPNERELLISGICGKCFDELFLDEEELEC